MAIRLPKRFRGYGCPVLFDVELNDFDLEAALQGLFFRVRSRGRTWVVPKRPEEVSELVKPLVHDPHLEGWHRDENGRRLLEQWLRVAVLKVGRRGRAHRGEKVQFVQPIHYLASKAPFRYSGYRRVHHFLYETLRDAVTDPSPESFLHRLFLRAFGPGASYEDGRTYDGHYADGSELDIEQALFLFFLEHVQPAGVSRSGHRAEPPALPRHAAQMGRDLVLFLESFADRLPARALTQMFLALISLHLTAYTRTLWAQSEKALPDRVWPLADEPVPVPECYLDFTGDGSGLSTQLATDSYHEDLDRIPAFLKLALLVRLADEYAQDFESAVYADRDTDRPSYLFKLLKSTRTSQFNMWASFAWRDLEQHADSDDLPRELLEETKQKWSRTGGDHIEKLVGFLYEVQHQHAAQNATRWLRSATALNRDYGCLVGSKGPGRRWYTLNRTALAAAVYLASVALKPPGSERQRAPQPRPFRLMDLLTFLRQRFGICIDRPPRHRDSAETRRAARENLGAFKRTLRQMGFFDDMSDDFTAQWVSLPGLTEPIRMGSGSGNTG